MNRWMILLATVAVAAFVVIGCAGGENPVTPTANQELTADSTPPGQAHTQLWGYWDVIFDVPSKSVEVIPNRSTEFTVNVVKFLNNDPAGVSFSFNGTAPGPGYVVVDLNVTIKHPLDDAGFNGYDVRGIFIGDGSGTLAYNTDLKYPVKGTDQILLNADGYSRWFNPTEFFVPKIWGYVPGNYATPGYSGSATLNPYKYFGEGLGLTENLWSYLTSGAPNTGCFLAGSSNTRNYQIRFAVPDPGIKYGYAVTADWAGEAPQFHPAHAPEAVACNVMDNSDVYYVDPTDNGGNLILDISLFGWKHQPSTIYIESTVLSAVANFDPVTIATGGGDHYSTYQVEIPADNVNGTEDQEYWVIAEYEGFDHTNNFGVPNLAGSDPLAASFRYDLKVGDFGWARTWGGSGAGSGQDEGYGVATDGSGNVYVTGWFWDTVDFDPNGGDPRTSNGGLDIFLSKFDSSGNFEWVRTWGGPDNDGGAGVAADGSGNVYVTGQFGDIVDFDPDGGDPHSSNGSYDAFLSKFDSSGNFEWARTWGGSEFDLGWGVAADGSGNVYIPGYFSGTVDFDPDGGDWHTSNYLSYDVFLSKFDSSGNFEWARTWGGADDDGGFEVATDGSGNVYVTGLFFGTVDFDPSGGDPHTSNGWYDVFLSRFDSSGNFEWAQTWGGPDWDEGYGVAVDASGNAYVTGYYEGTVDFDPGGGDQHISNGYVDAFLSKFDSSGNFLWARTWGGDWEDSGYGVVADGSGNVYVAGMFYDTVDFDPAGGDLQITNGEADVFLSKFDSSGNFKWARTWGGSMDDSGRGVAADGSSNVYVSGSFQTTANFAPTDPPCNEDPDEHTSNGIYDAFLTKHLPDGCW